MSASNWAICPRCRAEANGAYQNEHARVMALYGAIPVEEFDAERAKLVPVDPEADELRTLREDYEFFGAETGTVEFHYSAGCSKCGLGTRFQGERAFYPVECDPTVGW